MIVNPKKIIKEWIVTELPDVEKQVQQNGIDLTLASVREIIDKGILELDKRQLPSLWAPLGNLKGLESWIYSISFNEYVKIPNGMCAEIIQRSSLNRMWVQVVAWVYDAWFENTIWAVMYVHNPLGIDLELGVRLAQIVFHQAEEWDLYDGVYKIKK